MKTQYESQSKPMLSKSLILFIFFITLIVIVSGCSEPEKLSLKKFVLKIPLGLESASTYYPDDNPITGEKIELGRKLFLDERLSLDGTVSCATCHNPLRGFSDGRTFALGIYGQIGPRNTPTIINRLFSKKQFWDGRVRNLEELVLEHIQNPLEMANTLDNVAETLNASEDYRKAFRQIFDTDVTIEGVAKALASFQRSLMSADSPYDKYKAGDDNAISEAAKRGLVLFESKRVNCIACHSGSNFTDEKFQNNGAGMEQKEPDSGRFWVTKNDSDYGKFKTPTLRDISRTSPFMHDGSLRRLIDVINFYNNGGIRNKNLSKHVKPLNLTEQEKTDLVEFLKSLTGTNTFISKIKV